MTYEELFKAYIAFNFNLEYISITRNALHIKIAAPIFHNQAAVLNS